MKLINLRILPIVFIVTLTASVQGQLLMHEQFKYDGDITKNSSGNWLWHSGNGEPIYANHFIGRVGLGQDDNTPGGQDAHRVFSTTGFAPQTDNSTRLYAGFLVKFVTLPFTSGTNSGGSYFAHFMSSGTTEFYTRIGANQEGADSESLRIAIANENWDSATSIEHPFELKVGLDYLVVVRLDLATDQSTLWVNPQNESSPSVTATDAFSFPATGVIDSFALRQGTSGTSGHVGASGGLSIGDLKIGTTFDSVVSTVPEPSAIWIAGVGVLLASYRRRQSR